MSKTSMSIRLDSEVKEQAQLVFNHLGNGYDHSYQHFPPSGYSISGLTF